MKIVKYIILYNIMWGISITMCYFHRFIDDINYSLQDFLITFFELLAWIVLIIGAIDTFLKTNIRINAYGSTTLLWEDLYQQSILL